VRWCIPAAKAAIEKMAVIATLKRCATQKQIATPPNSSAVIAALKCCVTKDQLAGNRIPGDYFRNLLADSAILEAERGGVNGMRG
jgi:hypothetical protein